MTLSPLHLVVNWPVFTILCMYVCQSFCCEAVTSRESFDTQDSVFFLVSRSYFLIFWELKSPPPVPTVKLYLP